MNKFSIASLKKLEQVHPDLVKLVTEVLEYMDITVLCGHRSKEEQNVAYEKGNSKLRYPKSKHNSLPSEAVDIAPYPISFKDIKRYYYLAGIMEVLSKQLNIPIVWGGDWDNDGDFTDNKFNDLVHFELIKGK